MISAFGAILLIAAGGYAGFSALEHLRTALRSAETILDASRDMRTEILCHRTPLPQLLERLGARYPRLFPDAENASMLVREFSFLLGLDGEHSLCRAAQGAGRAASSAGDAALLRHGAGAGARCVGRFGPGSCAMRCEKRIVPPFGFIRRWPCRGCLLAVLLL